MRGSSKRQYIDEVFNGDYDAFHKARKADYLKEQLRWTCWMDARVKSGEITQADFDKEIF